MKANKIKLAIVLFVISTPAAAQCWFVGEDVQCDSRNAAHDTFKWIANPQPRTQIIIVPSQPQPSGNWNYQPRPEPKNYIQDLYYPKPQK